MRNLYPLLGAVLALATSAALAAVPAGEAARLKNDLTPLGAERAGNAAGTIPAWEGGLAQPPAGYVPGRHRPDPFAADKPLFTITQANLAQYQANLTPGEIALFKAYPDSFQMPVYPTRRTGAAPQWVYDNVFRNATSARLAEGGNGFTEAFGGVPFPIPANGLEALWNHIARYRGSYFVRNSSEAAVQRDGSFTPVTTQYDMLFKYYQQGGNFAGLNNTLFYYQTLTKAPARMAGAANLVRETLDQAKEPRQAWTYNPGQRRVRRAPLFAYDTPGSSTDGLRTMDDTDMFNGAPDRFDWTLVGKREIYIPYNNYRLGSPQVKYKDLIEPGHLDPQYTRYELHRVWVVEGRLKPGARHIYSKRTLYLDEDSWSVAVVDQYDSRGDLWRVSMAYLAGLYELPATGAILDVFHDLQSRRYMVQWLDNEQPGTTDYSQPAPNEDYFSPASLRARGVR
ncbi:MULTISPECIES: DUF1329 domain-containing protein [Pseudomonas aeruginosa group]|uniref:DUF1329 domain-containing protein n=1 Tax=Pseudomonas aeruginosa group TaxID=136841 RepID=UPI0006B2921A|nr:MULTISPECIES: DUF1329 domain-containing protein [Pseudomonas aeruginosa group]AVR67663.1 DUF1329 domain-containing protein [Pseudomonas paraeruginosa]KPD29248.1 hypothetical protein AN920_12115 [Pseudomonas paraeruginosa]KQB32362.1 hypothetical protein AOA77_13560 [Pseudomonas paraeruginosa]MBG3903570.1 DUF1329 domain-containing protein [Pseudomonas aeruginosa]MBG4202388.1 DUF1329 domain-containing protein [Pseudomonas aeruginosa]